MYFPDLFFTSRAEYLAESGTCSRLSVGAVLTRPADSGLSVVLGEGSNRSLSGPCYHPEGETCRLTLHAEAEAIASAARRGETTEGSVMYTTHSPCYSCAQLIVAAGVAEVVFSEEYRSAEGIGVLIANGVSVLQKS